LTFTVTAGTLTKSGGLYTFTSQSGGLNLRNSLDISSNQWEMDYYTVETVREDYNFPYPTAPYMKCFFTISQDTPIGSSPYNDLIGSSWEEVNYDLSASENRNDASSHNSLLSLIVLIFALFLLQA